MESVAAPPQAGARATGTTGHQRPQRLFVPEESGPQDAPKPSALSLPNERPSRAYPGGRRSRRRAVGDPTGSAAHLRPADIVERLSEHVSAEAATGRMSHAAAAATIRELTDGLR